ncbi:MAG: DUF805 domain-containing protein [Rhizobiaceae bacterium]|nr:DUF805 domain-containing protein [Rhizobiaceae bacterium]
MRGEVLHFDDEHGFGFITGADGKRYTFEKTDLRRDFPISKGTLVEFHPEEDKARDLFLIRGVGREAAAQTGEFGRFATEQGPVPTGMWSYFQRGLTSNYANFRDRARRKEFWSYYLFYYIALAVLITVCLFIDQAFGRLDAGGAPYVTVTAGLLFFVATIIPAIALQVRRQHDIGLSGWFYLLVFVPYIGGLILLVFDFIPSQPHENKWGPVPYGVRV